MEATQLGLPYQEITATRAIEAVKKEFKRGTDTIFIPMNQIEIREGFNIRKEYTHIEELAWEIFAQGLVSPLTVDVLGDGTIFLEQGHRRVMALNFLRSIDKIKEICVVGRQGLQWEDDCVLVECFVNRKNISELTRLKRQFTSNSGQPYTSLEIAELCKRLEKYFNLNHLRIASELGLSRQQVENMLILANESKTVKEAIQNEQITPTAAVELSRKISDPKARDNFINTQAGKGKIKVKDVKDLEPDEDKGIKGDRLDDTKTEVKLCNDVIGRLDKIDNLWQKSGNNLLDTIHLLVEQSQKDMDIIRKYVNRCTK